MQEFGFEGRLAGMKDLRVTEPLGYLEFLNLMSKARLVRAGAGTVGWTGRRADRSGVTQLTLLKPILQTEE